MSAPSLRTGWRSLVLNQHEELIEARDQIVNDYGALVPVREITSNVSAFPGGSGFLDGKPGERKVMFVLHNYDGSDDLNKPENYKSAFWLTLYTYIDGAGIPRDEAFVTNVYMGARPGKANGEMASFGGENFTAQCMEFFDKQVSIINPSLVIMCGNFANVALASWHGRPKVLVAHPSSNRDANKRIERAAPWMTAIRSALAETHSATVIAPAKASTT